MCADLYISIPSKLYATEFPCTHLIIIIAINNREYFIQHIRIERTMLNQTKNRESSRNFEKKRKTNSNKIKCLYIASVRVLDVPSSDSYFQQQTEQKKKIQEILSKKKLEVSFQWKILLESMEKRMSQRKPMVFGCHIHCVVCMGLLSKFTNETIIDFILWLINNNSNQYCYWQLYDEHAINPTQNWLTNAENKTIFNIFFSFVSNWIESYDLKFQKQCHQSRCFSLICFNTNLRFINCSRMNLMKSI